MPWTCIYSSKRLILKQTNIVGPCSSWWGCFSCRISKAFSVTPNGCLRCPFARTSSSYSLCAWELSEVLIIRLHIRKTTTTNTKSGTALRMALTAWVFDHLSLGKLYPRNSVSCRHKLLFRPVSRSWPFSFFFLTQRRPSL